MLSVRLPRADLRRLKSRAAARGLSLQTAVRQALRAWLDRAPSPAAPGGDDFEAQLDDFQGSLAGTDVLEDLRRERAEELARDRRRMGR